MIKVNGIAGVFVYAQDPKRLADWYALHFGLEFLSDIADTYFMEFYHRDDTAPKKRHSRVFARIKFAFTFLVGKETRLFL